MFLVQFMEFDYFIIKDKFEFIDVFEECLIFVIQVMIEVFMDCNIKELKKGVIVQLECKGYFCLDMLYIDVKILMVFFKIFVKQMVV